MNEEDERWLGVYESNVDSLESLDQSSLVSIIRALAARVDELAGIQRSPDGEEIIKDDEVVDDGEEYL